jgi:hypothetical protein
VECTSAGAIVNATASVVRSTHSLQCLELSFIFDEEWRRVILEALRSNQTVSSLKLALHTRFDKEATSDFVHFIRHECNRNGNVLRELVLVKPLPWMHDVESLETTPGKVVASMLQGSALEALSFPGSDCYRDNDDVLGAADLFQGLLHPTVTLPSLRLSMLDGPGVNDFVSFLAATTCLQHLTIVRLEQMHDICSLMSACRQNGSLHSISINHATENDTESSAEWASLHAWFMRRTMAFCSRNKELRFLQSDPVALETEAPNTATASTAKVDLFPMLVRVAQDTPRMGLNAVFAGLLASKCDTIGPDRGRWKQANGTK